MIFDHWKHCWAWDQTTGDSFKNPGLRDPNPYLYTVTCHNIQRSISSQQFCNSTVWNPAFSVVKAPEIDSKITTLMTTPNHFNTLVMWLFWQSGAGPPLPTTIYYHSWTDQAETKKPQSVDEKGIILPNLCGHPNKACGHLRGSLKWFYKSKCVYWSWGVLLHM